MYESLKGKMNRMNIRLLAIVFSGVCLLTGCKQTKSADDAQTVSQTSEKEVDEKPYAEISISPVIDMGVFKEGELKKSTLISLTNVGTDTLVIFGATPECECTTANVIDSVIPPHATGRMEVSLDVTGYPVDTLYKDINIVSNDKNGQVKTFRLMGVIQ